MVFSLRKLIERLKFAILFLTMTYLVYCFFTFVSSLVSPEERYRQPDGSAVKVFRHEAAIQGNAHTFWDRLILFYWYGE